MLKIIDDFINALGLEVRTHPIETRVNKLCNYKLLINQKIGRLMLDALDEHRKAIEKGEM